MYGPNINREPMPSDQIESMIESGKHNEAILGSIRLIYYIIEKYYPLYSDKEDLFQAGALGLVSAAHKFDPGKGKFSTYAAIAINNNIKYYLRGLKNQSADLSLEEKAIEDLPLLELIEIEDENLKAKLLLLDIRNTLRGMNNRHQEAFWLRVSGYSGVEAAKKLGYSDASTVQRAIAKARKMIRRDVIA